MEASEEVEYIPNEDFVLRNIHVSKHKLWTDGRKRPTEADFILREIDQGLSVNWERYCSKEDAYILTGVKKNLKGNYLNPKEFKVLSLNVGKIREIKFTSGDTPDVLHKPEPDNFSHAEICFEDQDEFRLKMCDLVHAEKDSIYYPENFDVILQKIEEKLAE